MVIFWDYYFFSIKTTFSLGLTIQTGILNFSDNKNNIIYFIFNFNEIKKRIINLRIERKINKK